MNKYFKVMGSLTYLSLMLLTGCDSTIEQELNRIVITPWPIKTLNTDGVTLAEGNSQPFKAIGLYSDGIARPLEELNISNWKSSDNNIGFFAEPGLLTGGSTPGVISVTANKNGIISNAVTVTITDATITSIVVNPTTITIPEGVSQQLEAIANYSDGSSYNKTEESVWHSFDKHFATISADGVVTGVNNGYTQVTATIEHITSSQSQINITDETITSLSIIPEEKSTVLRGFTQQLEAIGTYGADSDLSLNITDQVVWNTSSSEVTIDKSGNMTAEAKGSADVTATSNSIHSETLNVKVCDHLGEDCIDVFDLGDKTIYTNSPSESFVSSIGDEYEYECEAGKMDDFVGEYNNDGKKIRSPFCLYSEDNSENLCTKYNDLEIAGRENWRVPTIRELQVLVRNKGSMNIARNWPVALDYLSSEGTKIDLSNGETETTTETTAGYVSCISQH